MVNNYGNSHVFVNNNDQSETPVTVFLQFNHDCFPTHCSPYLFVFPPVILHSMIVITVLHHCTSFILIGVSFSVNPLIAFLPDY